MLTIAGLVIGAIAGYFYYDYRSCMQGTCLITARPLNTMIYGAIMGGLLFSVFQTNIKPKAYEQSKDDH